MDFTFTDEQRQLRETLSRFLAARYGFEARQKMLRSEAGWRPEIWKGFAEELGILGVALPEEVGGFGGGPVDNMIVMEELGRALVVEPYLETIVIGAEPAAPRRRRGGAGASVESIIAGEAITAFAWSEPGVRTNAADVATKAQAATAQGWRLSRPQGRRRRRAVGHASSRHRAHGRRAARPRRCLTVPRRPQGRTASPCATTPPSTAAAPPRSPSTTSLLGADVAARRRRAARWRMSRPCWMRRARRCARRRSA